MGGSFNAWGLSPPTFPSHILLESLMACPSNLSSPSSQHTERISMPYMVVMVNFVYQQGAQLLYVSVRVFFNEINIFLCTLSKADCST